MNNEDRINNYNMRRATKRLNRELNIIDKDQIPGIDLCASKDNILEWHFVIHGKEDTPYYGGMYHGKLIFPSNYPFAPPSIIFLTLNGRFKTNERICFSISDFHPEQWKSSYSVVDLLYGVRDFMHENTETIGSIETSESEKRQLAESSSIHNGKDTIFFQLFPKLCGIVTDSEDSSSESSPSKNTISPVREMTPSPDEITLLPRTQSPISTEVTLPSTHLTPAYTGVTPPFAPRETAKPEETHLSSKETVVSRDESSSPREIIKSSGEVSRIPSESIQEQRTITRPTHITPSVTRPMFYPVRYPGAQPSSRGVRPPLEKIELEERPADNPAEKRTLHSPPIKRSPGGADSQRKLPSLPKEIIPQVKTDYPALIAHPLEMNFEDRFNSRNLRRATKRLNRELNIIDKDPIPGIDLRINEDNILEWHFVIHGKEDTPYYGGMYHVKLIFPSNFPFGPPKILFLTPNGRFKTNERICFSLSDFHPEEWKPAFSVTTILQGVTELMHDSTETIGSIETSESVKREFAENSSIHNGKYPNFCYFFPHLCRRRVKHSEDSSGESWPLKDSNTFADIISSVREKIPPPDEIYLPPRIQPPTSAEIPLPSTHLTPGPSEITPLPPQETLLEIIRSPGDTHSLKKTPAIPEIPSPERDFSPYEEKSLFGNKITQKEKDTAHPPRTTPSVTRTIHERVRPVRTRSSKEEVRTLAQNESQKPFTISPINSKQQNFEPNPQTLESIELEERRAQYFDENRKLPSPPVRYPGATPPQRNLPYLPKEIIPRQTPTPEREICPDIERGYPSIGVITPVDGEILDGQEADVYSLRHHKFKRNTRRIHITIFALVVFLVLILGLLLIALLFIFTQT